MSPACPPTSLAHSFIHSFRLELACFVFATQRLVMAAADDDDDLYGDLGGQENIYEISEELKRLRQENEQLRSRVLS